MQLKGTKSGTNGSTKTKRVVDFKLRVLSLKASGTSAKEALEQACQEFNVPLTAGMVKHPHSFVNMYKASINGLLAKGDKAVEAKVVAAGLADTSAPQAEAEEPVEPSEAELAEEERELADADESEDFEPSEEV